MSLKFNLKTSKEAAEKARANRGTRYEGPTPPPGLYNFELKQLTVKPDKNDNPRLSARLSLKETGDEAEYNGWTLFYGLSFPMDPDYEHYHIQYNQMDSFLMAASGGTYSVDDFIKDANAGKIIDDGKTNKGADIIKSIGKFHVAKAKEFEAKIKLGNSLYQGERQMEVHYIPDVKVEKVEKPAEDLDMDDASSDEIDELLS